VNFEDYLQSKRIDSSAFQKSEPHLWNTWKAEFEQMHVASFTAQKLYLINPVRRKYLLKTEPVVAKGETAKAENPSVEKPSQKSNEESAPNPAAKPAVARPVFRPKPKMT
jgi:hypothetical protein